MKARIPVFFRTWLPERGAPAYASGVVSAIFPTLRADEAGDITSYERDGGHGAASLDVILAQTRPSTREELWPLALELERIGYKIRLGTEAELWEVEARGRNTVSALRW